MTRGYLVELLSIEAFYAGVYPSYDERGVRDDVLDAFGV